MEIWVIANGRTADEKVSSGQLTTFQASNWRREQRTAPWRLAEPRKQQAGDWPKAGDGICSFG